MNTPKNTEFLHGEPFSSSSGVGRTVGRTSPRDEEYQLIFLLDRPLPGTARRGSPIPAEVAEHILHLPPAADNLDSRT
jgi:hypothetical protein